MNILALDTSMGTCSAAVLRADGTRQDLFVHAEFMARGHAEALMPMVADVMAEAGVTPSGLDLIAATLGPGSFTGVRIAIAAARGLALATGAKLWGADSLTVMAQGAVAETDLRQAGRPFAVAVDARRSMLYFGLFDAAGARLQGPVLIAPEDAAALLPGDVAVAVGSGAELLAETAEMRSRRVVTAALPDLQPEARSLAVLALAGGETSPTLRPLYLRPPDAKPQAAATLERR
ncbi:MAG: tRNA (adenosine(37)-N6)-threonylcarbamoyltransferase complex dimerization subunit type 1 TsaB [Methyloceanibacter sp.]